MSDESPDLPVSTPDPAADRPRDDAPDAPNLGTGPNIASLSDPVPEEAASGSLAQVKVPTQTELDELPADRRLELLEQGRARADAALARRRQSLHQWINSGVLLIGALLARRQPPGHRGNIEHRPR
jgi:hypothetical protein